MRAADREVWRLLSKEARGQLRAKSGADPPPLEALVDGVLASMEVNLLLMPLPRAAAGSSGSSKRPPGDRDLTPEKTSSRSKRRARLVDSLKKKLAEKEKQDAPPPAPHPAERPKGRGRGRPAMPRQLWGGVAETPDGQRICFGFNLGSCKVTGDKCDKGVHVCSRKGCGGRHPATECAL